MTLILLIFLVIAVITNVRSYRKITARDRIILGLNMELQNEVNARTQLQRACEDFRNALGDVKYLNRTDWEMPGMKGATVLDRVLAKIGAGQVAEEK